MGHLNEIFTAEEGSIIELLLEPQADEDEGDMFETVPVPQTSAGDAVICWSELTSSADEFCPEDMLVLVEVKELKFLIR